MTWRTEINPICLLALEKNQFFCVEGSRTEMWLLGKKGEFNRAANPPSFSPLTTSSHSCPSSHFARRKRILIQGFIKTPHTFPNWEAGTLLCQKVTERKSKCTLSWARVSKEEEWTLFSFSFFFIRDLGLDLELLIQRGNIKQIGDGLLFTRPYHVASQGNLVLDFSGSRAERVKLTWESLSTRS